MLWWWWPLELLKWLSIMAEDVLDTLGSMFDCSEFDDFASYPAGGSGTMEPRDFKREMLNAHNNYRTLHGCPPLALSEELTHTAQSWAEKLADRGILQYSENPNLGENVCMVDLDPSPSRKGEQVVKEWYKEIDHYNYDSPGWKRSAYRASQLLWKSTSEIGVGVAKVPGQNRAFVVVNYRPAGNNNVPGEFERNVLPPLNKKQHHPRDDNTNLRKMGSPRRS